MSLTALTTAVAILGRLDLGVLGRNIQSQFGFSTQTMGWIFSAFAFGYQPFQIPAGWAGDRFGPRRILTVSILLWAAATAATGVVARLHLVGWLGLAWSFAILRFLIGLGEAPTSPNVARVVSSWMGSRRRGIGVSFHIVGIGAGGALSPLLITAIAARWGWPPCFYVAGALGAVVALLWWFYFTDRPEDHPRVNAPELAHIHPPGGPALPPARSAAVPWRRMLSQSAVWGLLLSYFCQGYMPYIYMTWFFIYLEHVRGLTPLQGGLWGSVPFLSMMALAPLGGALSDRWTASLGKRRGRQLAVWLGMGISALLLAAGAHASNTFAAIFMLALAAGFNYFALPSWWATCIDLAPEHAGALSGLMNMCSGGWLAPILTAYIVVHFGWTPALDFAALITAFGGLLWFLVDAGRAIA